MPISRRTVLSRSLTFVPLLLTSPALFGQNAIEPDRVQIPLPGGRMLDILVWAPPQSRAAIVFSHGMGGHPQAYQLLISTLNAAGYAVAAPVHVDSLKHPQHKQFPLPATFGERVTDLHTTLGFMQQRFARQPIAAAGHSYGALLSWCLGGALANVGPMRAPAVSATLTFSSPGVLPMMKREGSLGSLQVPNLSITGTRDVVPGFVTDWQDHLLAHEQSKPGHSWAIVVQDGEHELVTKPDAIKQIAPAMLDFLAAHLHKDVEALQRLNSVKSDATFKVMHTTRR